MINLNQFRPVFAQFIKYGFASILSYTFIFGGSYLLVDVLGVRANLSYLFITTVSYIYLYFVSKKIFDVAKDDHRTVRFLAHLAVFWLANNVFFNAIFLHYHINHLLIIVMNIVIFAPIRFLSLRHFVWHKRIINPRTNSDDPTLGGH